MGEIAKLAESTKSTLPPQEMEIIIRTLTSRLGEVEQELSDRIREHSEVVDPFFKSAYNSLMQICRTCEKFDAARDNNQNLPTQRLPAFFDPESQDTRMKFIGILNALCYVLEVISPPGKVGYSGAMDAAFLTNSNVNLRA